MRRLKDHVGKSNWTPCTHAPSKEEIFQERMKLITNWFDMWTHPQRSQFFDHFLKRCDRRQLAAVEKFFVESIPLERIDFTTVFPRHLSLFIFSFLDPKTLSRASAVSWHWKFLAEQDALWIPKCTKHAWYLPYNPPPGQLGSWKRHYISCIQTLDFKVSEGGKSLWSRQLEEKHQQNIKKQMSAKSQKLWKFIEKSIKDKSVESRAPWVPSNKFPKDLLLGRKEESKRNKRNWDVVLQSFGSDSDPGSCHVSKWKETKDALVRMNESDIEILLERGETSPRPERLSEELKLENLMERRITELKEFQNQRPRFWDPASILESSFIPVPYDVTSEFCKRSEISKVIFISSEVPSCDVLTCALFPDVVHVLYDFSSTNLDSLLFRLHSVIRRGAMRPRLIGFLLHQERPFLAPFSDLLLTDDLSSTTSDELRRERASKFFEAVAGLLTDGGCVDVFHPMASCEEGRRLLTELSSTCGAEFRSPTNVLHKYDFYGTPWFSTSPSKVPQNSPSESYFSGEKFAFWWNEMELMEEACGKVSDVLGGYFKGIRKRAVSRMIGQIMYNAFGFSTSEYLKKTLRSIADGLEMLRDCPEGDLITKLGKYFLSCHEQETKESGSEDCTSQLEGSRIKFDDGTLKKTLKSSKDSNTTSQDTYDSSVDDDDDDKNDAKSSLISVSSFPGKTKSSNDNHLAKEYPEETKKNRGFIGQSDVSQLQVLNNLLSTEEYYNACLKSLVKVFEGPVVVSLETNRALVSWQNAKLLFDDVDKLFGISSQFLEDLRLTRKKRPSRIFLGRLFLRFLKSFGSLLRAYLLVYPSVLETYDKCKRQSHQFRAFLRRFEGSFPSLMRSMPELYARPWKRVNEYSRLLVAYKDSLPHDNPDVRDLDASLSALGDLQDLIGENIQRLGLIRRMETIQERIKNCPKLRELGRRLLKEIEVAHHLAPCQSVVPELRVYRHIGNLHFYLFDDCLLCSTKIISSVPFESREKEEQVYGRTSSLRFIRIVNIPDSPYIKNGFKIWTPRHEWICSVPDEATKSEWISVLEQAILLYLNNSQ